EMIALGDKLRADDDVDQSALDIGHKLCSLGGRPERVRRDDRGARLGKAQRHLVGDALDPGAAGDQTVLVLTLGTQPRGRHHMSAVVAGEAVNEAMLDHPGGAVRALDAVPAGPAKCERRKAAAIEKQEALFALVEPV